MAVFEGLKKVDTDIVCLQNSYVRWSMLALPAYEIVWEALEERKEQRVTIPIVVTTRNRIIVEVRIDIFNHPYKQELDIWELEETGEKKKSRTR